MTLKHNIRNYGSGKIIDNNFDNVFIVLLFVSMNFGSKFVINVGIKITFTDIMVLVGLFYIIIKRNFTCIINKYQIFLFGLIFIIFLIEMLSVIFIDLGTPDNITLAIALLRNFAIIFIISQLTYNFEKVSTLIIISSFFFSLLAIILYAKALTNYFEIVSSPHLWEPEIIYTLDSGILRLQGLREDPNFFFLNNLLPLFLIVFKLKTRKNIIMILMFIIILTALILTFSRSGIILLFLFFLLLAPKILTLKQTFKFSLFMILMTLVTIYITTNTYNILNPFDIIASRFEKIVETGGSGRVYLWHTAWSGFQDSIFWGQGGRYVLKKAGNYTHNDYLEMLSSHGLVGFIFMLILYWYILIYSLKKFFLLKENYFFIANVYLFIFLIIASLFFTIFYNPYIWLTISFIFSQNRRIKYDKNFNCYHYLQPQK